MLEVLRQYRRRSATRMGVVLAGVWLAFAAVPCSALEQVGIDLGHMHAAQAVAASEHACPHCPAERPAAVTPAATPGDCSGVDDALSTKLAGSDFALGSSQALPALVPAAAVGRASALAPRAPERPPAVPLNLRYCTFLE